MEFPTEYYRQIQGIPKIIAGDAIKDKTVFDINSIEDVLWSITDLCNLKCVYCSVEAGGMHKPIVEPTRIEIDIIAQQLERLPNLNSIILSGGEALLAKNFPYIIESVFKLCRQIYVITNGVMLKPRIIDSLLTFRPTVMISIDSTKEEINKITREVGALEKSLTTLKVLQSLGIDVIVISVVTKHNIDFCDEYLNNLYELGINKVLLQQLHCEGRSDKELFLKLSPSLHQINNLYELVESFKEKHKDVIIDCNEICYYQMRKKAYEEKCDESKRYKPQRLFMCGAGYNFFAIKVNGDVIPCNALRSCVFGNLVKEDIIDILMNSDESNNVRMLRHLRIDQVAGCEDCKFAPMCDGGCRADALHLTGNILSKHPYCGINIKV